MFNKKLILLMIKIKKRVNTINKKDNKRDNNKEYKKVNMINNKDNK